MRFSLALNCRNRHVADQLLVQERVEFSDTLLNFFFCRIGSVGRPLMRAYLPLALADLEIAAAWLARARTKAT